MYARIFLKKKSDRVPPNQAPDNFESVECDTFETRVLGSRNTDMSNCFDPVRFEYDFKQNSDSHSRVRGKRFVLIILSGLIILFFLFVTKRTDFRFHNDLSVSSCFECFLR